MPISKWVFEEKAKTSSLKLRASDDRPPRFHPALMTWQSLGIYSPSSQEWSFSQDLEREKQLTLNAKEEAEAFIDNLREQEA